jgi:PIN domain nuclease of toxin-antitoxin system
MARGEPVILLDTCALLWLNGDRRQFTPVALRELNRQAGALAISAISLFEIGIKAKRGKLRLPLPPRQWFHDMTEQYHLLELPITADIAAKAADLPEIHVDAFDRLIIATAMHHHASIVTADRTIPSYPGVRVVW